jgi:hypothetical protein
MTRPMTRQAFLHEVRLLRDKGYDPQLDPTGRIVIIAPSGLDRCVLTAVAEMRTGTYFALEDFAEAGRRIGLRPAMCERIAEAHDSPDHEDGAPRQWRRLLLGALELTSTPDGRLPSAG